MRRHYHATDEDSYFENSSDDDTQNKHQKSKFDERKVLALRFLEKQRQKGQATVGVNDSGIKEDHDAKEDSLDAFMEGIGRTLREQEQVKEQVSRSSIGILISLCNCLCRWIIKRQQ